MTTNDQWYILRLQVTSSRKLNFRKEEITLLANLEKALTAKGITKRAYASILGVTEKTLMNKIKEDTPFTYPEVKKTKTDVLPEYDTDFLFSSNSESE